MSEDLKNLSEIIELCQDELNKNDENITAILDLQDLKSLKNIINDYKRQVEINQEHQKVNGELRQKIKELEDADLTTIYLNGVYDGKHKVNEEIKKILNVNIIRAINKDGEIFYNEEVCIEIVKQLKKII